MDPAPIESQYLVRPQPRGQGTPQVEPYLGGGRHPREIEQSGSCRLRQWMELLLFDQSARKRKRGLHIIDRDAVIVGNLIDRITSGDGADYAGHRNTSPANDGGSVVHQGVDVDPILHDP